MSRVVFYIMAYHKSNTNVGCVIVLVRSKSMISQKFLITQLSARRSQVHDVVAMRKASQKFYSLLECNAASIWRPERSDEETFFRSGKFFADITNTSTLSESSERVHASPEQSMLLFIGLLCVAYITTRVVNFLRCYESFSLEVNCRFKTFFQAELAECVRSQLIKNLLMIHIGSVENFFSAFLNMNYLYFSADWGVGNRL